MMKRGHVKWCIQKVSSSRLWLLCFHLKRRHSFFSTHFFLSVRFFHFCRTRKHEGISNLIRCYHKRQPYSIPAFEEQIWRGHITKRLKTSERVTSHWHSVSVERFVYTVYFVLHKNLLKNNKFLSPKWNSFLWKYLKSQKIREKHKSVKWLCVCVCVTVQWTRIYEFRRRTDIKCIDNFYWRSTSLDLWLDLSRWH